MVLLGHSKGGLDAAAALSIYEHELKDKVVGLVVAQSPYGGTPIASDIMRRGQLVDEQWRWMLEMGMKKIFKVRVLRIWVLNIWVLGVWISGVWVLKTWVLKVYGF